MNFSIGSVVDFGSSMISEGEEDGSSSSFPSHPYRSDRRFKSTFENDEDPHRPTSASPSPFLGPNTDDMHHKDCDASYRLPLSTWTFDKEGLDTRANVAEVPRFFFPALAASQCSSHNPDSSLLSKSPNTAGSGDHPFLAFTTTKEGRCIQSSSLNGTTNPIPGHYYSNCMHGSVNPSSFVSNNVDAVGYGASSPMRSILGVDISPGGGGGVASPISAGSRTPILYGSPTGRPVPRIQLLTTRHKRQTNSLANSLCTSSSASYSQGAGTGASGLGDSSIVGDGGEITHTKK